MMTPRSFLLHFMQLITDIFLPFLSSCCLKYMSDKFHQACYMWEGSERSLLCLRTFIGKGHFVSLFTLLSSRVTPIMLKGGSVFTYYKMRLMIKSSTFRKASDNMSYSETLISSVAL